MRSLMSWIASVLEEDHFRPQTTKRLVRRRRDHVAMLEGRGVLLRGNKARDVSDVRHEDGRTERVTASPTVMNTVLRSRW